MKKIKKIRKILLQINIQLYETNHFKTNSRKISIHMQKNALQNGNHKEKILSQLFQILKIIKKKYCEHNYIFTK